MGETCSNCKFWLGPTDSEGYRSCRRYPPENKPHPVRGVVTVYRPLTSETDWCGEHVELPITLGELYQSFKDTSHD